MPRVQAYGQPQVATSPVPNVRQGFVPGPASFGAQLGETISKVGQQALVEEQANQDQLAVQSADRQLSDWVNKRLYDPESGALLVKGKDALGLQGAVGDEFNKQADAISQGLANGRQRMAFERSANGRYENLSLELSRHTEQQMAAYDQAETSGAIDSAKTAAAQNATDPRRVAQELNRTVAVTMDYARRNGLGPDATQSAVDKTRTDFHTAVIDGLLATDRDQAAKVYFEEVKNQISGDSLARIERAVQAGTLAGESQRTTDSIMGSAKTETEALDRVRALEDPQLRDQVQSRVEHEWAIRKMAERDQQDAMMLGVANLLDKNPQAGIKAIPKNLWSTMTIGQRETAMAYAKRFDTGDKEGKTDIPTWYRLRQLATNDPAKFSQLQLTDYMGRLSRTDFKGLADVQASIIKGDQKALENDDFRSVNEIVTDTFHAIGMNPNDKENYAAVGQFHQLLAEQARKVQQATGKPPTKDDLQKLAADLISRSVAVPTRGILSWLGIGSPVTSKRLTEITIDDVPYLDRKAIEASLQRNGRQADDAAILQVFIASRVQKPK